MSSDALQYLSSGKYVLVTTFRRSGVAVPTPVWFAMDGDAVVIWSVADAGKVKRLRNNPEVRLAPCTVRGVPTGPETTAYGTLLTGADTERVRGLLRRRYGLIGRITFLGSRLRRGRDGTVGIRLTPDRP